MTRPAWEIAHGVVVRPYMIADLEQLWSVVDHERERLGRWLHWANLTRTIDDQERWLRSVTSAEASDEHYAIVADGEIAGNVGLMLDMLEGDHEIGYWLASPFEGRGLVTRACREVITHAFTEHEAHRVTIAAAVSNPRSRAIPERLGFVLDGIAREATRTHEGFSDLAIYGVLDREWHP